MERAEVQGHCPGSLAAESVLFTTDWTAFLSASPIKQSMPRAASYSFLTPLQPSTQGLAQRRP